jgi:hypothetical protein
LGIAGNYNSTVATDYDHCGCKAETSRQEELSHLSYEWTKQHVSSETKRFLSTLPFRMDFDDPRGEDVPEADMLEKFREIRDELGLLQQLGLVPNQ